MSIKILLFFTLFTFTQVSPLANLSDTKYVQKIDPLKNYVTLKRVVVGSSIIMSTITIGMILYLLKKLGDYLGPDTLPGNIINNNIEKLTEIINNKQTDINEVNRFGITPIFFAVLENNLEMLKVLIEGGADVNVGKIKWLNFSLLHWAINDKKVDIEVIAFLIENGANLDARSLGNVTPIMLAHKRGRIDIVGLLASQASPKYNSYYTPAQKQNFYKVLNLKVNASRKEIKSQYKRLAFKFHPDRHTDLDQEEKRLLTKRFVEINEASTFLLLDLKNKPPVKLAIMNSI